MIPAPFDYSAPATLEEALKLAGDGSSKILAGGMSLIPLMKLRLASPESVIDLGRIPGLNQITESGGAIRIGAMATHHAVEGSPLIRGKLPLLAETAGQIGDIQVRNMGTLGGSIAHADPAADYPAALVALEARIHLRSTGGERAVEASEFFLDAFTTAMEPGEIVTGVEIAAEAPSEGYKYEKVPHPASGFPVVGVAVRLSRSGGKITLARVGVTGMSSHAFRARNAEQVLVSGGNIAAAAGVVGEGIDANSDLYASADYRLHLARVHAARALTAALSRAS
ncbi:MAG TPA: xanthine dehydrogenase family protein subunit M [Candidatus Acidoferrales bacterium]|nr:xanthine dehydrogenase family protein subunit M [Candidatus Acidoferrales bacterium]